jgi:hypothetical protein
MYYLHVFIDTLQKTKKDTFAKLVSDKDLQHIANNYVDAQTKFAKTMIDGAWDLLEHSLSKANKSFSKGYFPEAPYKVEPKENKQ